MRKAFGALCSLFVAYIVGAGTPDLMVYGPSARPYIEIVNFAPGSCEVNEGCAVPGARRLLRFETESRNVGDGDLVFGDPANNPLFVYDNCHGHYHFGQFTEYRLLTAGGVEVVDGKKIGFCLEDTIRWDPNGPVNRLYNCGYQGIRRGWADVYTYDVPCQWIDITGVAAGTYILEMRVDPLNHIPELNEGNNVAQVTVEISGDCSTRPANDAFAGAQTIPTSPASVSGNTACATKEPGERSHAGNAGGRSVWYRWIAPSNATVIINTETSTFDTLLAVYRLSGQSLVLVAENDDIVPQVVRVSQVVLSAQAGVEYRIAIDGWGGEFGSYRLNVDAPANDHIANCAPLQGLVGTVLGHNIGATHEAGEPTHASTFGAHSVWYCWTAPKNGVVYWDTFASTFDTTLAVYTGASMGSLTLISGDNDSGPNGTSMARVVVASNITYRIAVDGRGNTAGNIALRWEYPRARVVAQRQSNAEVRISIFGENGLYHVQGSTDLKSWARTESLTVTNGNGSFTTLVTPGPHFYRARLAQ